jgi:hypothetical protein
MIVDPQAEAERLRQTERRRWFEERCGREPWFRIEPSRPSELHRMTPPLAAR